MQTPQMSIFDLKMQVEKLIEASDIDNALKLLVEFTTSQAGFHKSKQGALSLRRKFNALQESYRVRGLLSHQEYEIESNKITDGIFTLLKSLEKDSPLKYTYRKLWPVAVVLLLALAAGLIFRENLPPVSGEQEPSTSTSAVTLQPKQPSDSAKVHETISTVHNDPANNMSNHSSTAPSNVGRNTNKLPDQPPPATVAPKTEKFKVTLEVSLRWKNAEVLIDGSEAVVLDRYGNHIELEVEAKTSNQTITLKSQGEYCEKKQKMTPDIVITLNCM